MIFCQIAFFRRKAALTIRMVVRMPLENTFSPLIRQCKDVPVSFSLERNKTLYVDYHPMTPK